MCVCVWWMRWCVVRVCVCVCTGESEMGQVLIRVVCGVARRMGRLVLFAGVRLILRVCGFCVVIFGMGRRVMIVDRGVVGDFVCSDVVV